MLVDLSQENVCIDTFNISFDSTQNNCHSVNIDLIIVLEPLL